MPPYEEAIIHYSSRALQSNYYIVFSCEAFLSETGYWLYK